MKKKNNYPVPTKVLKNEKDIEEYINALIFNTLNWLKIDGYIFYTLFPKHQDFIEHKGAGMSITTDYPYKKFKVSIQQDSIDKMLKGSLSERFLWENIEKSVFHECLHILSWRSDELGRRRYVTPTELEDANEEMTDHLTNVIYELVESLRKK